MNAQDLKWILCPGRNTSDLKLFHDIYNFWVNTWTEAYKELKVDKDLYSDSFTRQDYIGALQYKGQIIACTFFKKCRKEELTHIRDSYFSNWSEKHLDVLFSRGSNTIVCSQFTVHALARGKSLGFSTKDILMGMLIKTFLESQFDSMTGATRQDRNVHTASERWGVITVEENVPSGFGDFVAIQSCFKDECNAAFKKNELAFLCESLWKSRVDISSQDVAAFEFFKVG